MTKDPQKIQFLEAKGAVVENLKAIQFNLLHCTDEGMLDEDSSYYNELLSLIDEARISGSWAELEEVISKGKTLEIDVDVWMAGHGRTSLSLTWPQSKG